MSRSDLNPIYRDTFSSGDTKESKLKYQEENNNEVDELSKDLSNMGCIIDTVKKQPNICVETCVYESEDDENEDKTTINDEDAYSDEFEEDKSDESVISVAKSTQSDKSISVTSSAMKAAVKLTQSHTTMSSTKMASCSGRSTSFGSVSVPQTRRINMSFSNERLREIERHNHILLSKIMSARNTKKSSIPPQELGKKPVPSAAVMRKKQQRQIDHDNMILLKKIQRAKSSAYSVRR